MLLEQAGRSAKLTAVGLELVRNTEAILAAVERAESDLAATHGRPQGVVTVAVFASISRSIMPAALAALAHEHPGFDVRLQLFDPEQAALRLVSRRVDAVVTDSYLGTQITPAGGIVATVLGRDPVRGYLPDPRAGADFEQLRHVRWVMESREAGMSLVLRARSSTVPRSGPRRRICRRSSAASS